MEPTGLARRFSFFFLAFFFVAGPPIVGEGRRRVCTVLRQHHGSVITKDRRASRAVQKRLGRRQGKGTGRLGMGVAGGVARVHFQGF
ncbi:hypothetical protein BDF14DRAFT_1834959 [Spinellus fusiger]|nr:hypothetical protein BDF14DRAFT_1834959 [Spinellus fusiger]